MLDIKHWAVVDVMKWLLSQVVVAALLWIPTCSYHGDPPAGKKPAPPDHEATKITLHPMPETRPALRYQLLPPLLDRHPGNAAVHWNALSAERTAFLTEYGKRGGMLEKVQEWMLIPLVIRARSNCAPKNPRSTSFLMACRTVLWITPRASDSCDWQLPIREGRVYSISLPEAQITRMWGDMLAAKVHGEVADMKYADAVRTLQTGFALARHAAQGPTLVHGLIGTAIAGRMTNQVEQFVQRPGAPNLYWALASLPSPLIDFRAAYEFEMNGFVLHFTELQGLDKKTMSKEEWAALLGRFTHDFFTFSTFIGNVNAPGCPGPSELSCMGKMLLGYPRAKKYLIDRGRAKAEVEAMPQAQVVLLYTLAFYEELRDNVFKCMYLPYPQANIALQRTEADLKRRRDEELIPIAGMLLSSASSVKEAETRMQWIIARLRVLEALRIYAAAHDGKLPDQLGDIHEVPVPVNPFDDQPFTYRRDGNHALLGCESGPRSLPWRYEIIMARTAH